MNRNRGRKWVTDGMCLYGDVRARGGEGAHKLGETPRVLLRRGTRSTGLRLTGKGRAGVNCQRKKGRKGIRERWSRNRRRESSIWRQSHSKLSTLFSSTPSISSLIHSFSVHVHRTHSLLFSSMVVSLFCPLLKVFFKVRLFPHSTHFLIDS